MPKPDTRTSIPLTESQVALGAILQAVVILLAMFGIDVTESQSELLLKGAIAAMSLFGGGLAIYGRATTRGARPLRMPRLNGGTGAAGLALACLLTIPLMSGCATLGSNLDRVEQATKVGDVLVDAAEEAGLIDESTAERVRGYIRNARTAITLARLALEEGNREAAMELARTAQAAVREAEEALRYAAPPEAAPVALNGHVAALRHEADAVVTQVAAGHAIAAVAAW